MHLDNEKAIPTDVILERMTCECLHEPDDWRTFFSALLYARRNGMELIFMDTFMDAYVAASNDEGETDLINAINATLTVCNLFDDPDDYPDFDDDDDDGDIIPIRPYDPNGDGGYATCEV